MSSSVYSKVQQQQPAAVPVAQPAAVPVAKGVPMSVPTVGVVALDPNNIDTYMQDGVVMAQKTSQCCRFCCCQPEIDWELRVLTEDISVLPVAQQRGGYEQLSTVMNVKEESDYCQRCWSYCLPGFRRTLYTVRGGSGGVGTGPVLMRHSKGQTCGVSCLLLQGDGGPVRIPMCCDLPYIRTEDAAGAHLGTSRYDCDACLCVPKYHTEDPQGNIIYRVRPDTCVAGMCVQCKCCDGKPMAKCCRIPFYIRDPATLEKVDSGAAKITDLWAGWAHECCTQRDLYSVTFPHGCSVAQKATLLGMGHLIDITMYEQEGQK